MTPDERADQANTPESRVFAVLAELIDETRPLIQLNLSFERLLEDIVLPYESDRTFFIDGVPATKKRMRRLKIVADRGHMNSTFADLHWRMRFGSGTIERSMTQELYRTRVEAILHEHGDDVTSQVISAYERTIKDRVADWLDRTDKKTLVEGAWKVLLEGGIKLLGSPGNPG